MAPVSRFIMHSSNFILILISSCASGFGCYQKLFFYIYINMFLMHNCLKIKSGVFSLA